MLQAASCWPNVDPPSAAVVTPVLTSLIDGWMIGCKCILDLLVHAHTDFTLEVPFGRFMVVHWTVFADGHLCLFVFVL